MATSEVQGETKVYIATGGLDYNILLHSTYSCLWIQGQLGQMKAERRELLSSGREPHGVDGLQQLERQLDGPWVGRVEQAAQEGGAAAQLQQLHLQDHLVQPAPADLRRQEAVQQLFPAPEHRYISYLGQESHTDC
jgi:hypothetical protein